MSSINEENTNDDFLDALADSQMPDLEKDDGRDEPNNQPEKSPAELEREKMQQELKDRQNEESYQQENTNKKPEEKETDFESIKPSASLDKSTDENAAPLNPDNVRNIVNDMKISNSTENNSDESSTPVQKKSEESESFKREVKNDWIDHSDKEEKQDAPPSEPVKEVEVKEDEEEKIISDPKPVVAKTESVIGKVDILSSEEIAAKEAKEKNKQSNIKKDVEIDDNLDKKVVDTNDKIDAQAFENDDSDEDDTDLTIEELNKELDNNYVDDTSAVDGNITVDIVSENKSKDPKKTKQKKKPSVKKEIETPFYGGDGVTSSFKLRTSKIGKVLRNVNINNTDELDPVDISTKTPTERQDFYLKTVLPTLQPSIAVVPLIISGVVISMTAFGWPDLREIVAYEDKLNELDPSSMRDDEYIHAKNQLFIEKRRKQCDLFYKHINSVTGYVVKPSKEELFGKIIKFPDFPQLFFAAYAASFLKPYSFDIGCPICGANKSKEVVAKELCFLLNSNIDINRLNYFIQHGTALGQEETAKVYNEFQKEKLVELSTAKYRTKKNLPISSFVYELSIPTVYEALDAMDEIIEVFRDIDLSYTETATDENGEIVNISTVYIDSSFGLSKQLTEMRKYLYLHSLIVPEIIEENKENKSAKIGFTSIEDKPAVIQSIYNLSSEDYNTLINDPNLNKLSKVSGIRHAIKGGECENETCKADLGFVPAEPETLFFILARHDLKS